MQIEFEFAVIGSGELVHFMYESAHLYPTYAFHTQHKCHLRCYHCHIIEQGALQISLRAPAVTMMRVVRWNSGFGITNHEQDVTSS
jgi:hypothetical protein